MNKFSQKSLLKQASSQKISLLIGNRIPKEFYITSGIGESDITIHAGSYDKAVKDAGIENFNHIFYTSILPKGAQLVDKPKEMVHGAVMETIPAISNARKDQRATAGLIFGWIHDKQTGENLGGIVAEYNEHGDEETAKRILKDSIDEMFKSRYGNSDKYELRDTQIIIRSFIPKKKFGTAIVALCFTNYLYPVIGYEYSDNGKVLVKKNN